MTPLKPPLGTLVATASLPFFRDARMALQVPLRRVG
jgi:hypothetical protein